MKFTELPIRLRLYIAAHAVVLVPLVLLLLQRPAPTHWGLVAWLLGFTVIASTWKVELTVLQGKMTLTFAAVCLALILEQAGVQAAVLCSVVGALVGSYVRASNSEVRRKILRPSFYKVFFNVGNCALASATSAILFAQVQSWFPGGDVGTLLGLAAFTTSFFLINTVGVALAISLERGQSWVKLWQDNFFWTAPGFFASASVAIAFNTAWVHLHWWSLFFLPWLYVIYHSYRLYMDRLNQDIKQMVMQNRHIEELNKLNQAIISSLATAIDAKDRYTCSHINRVQQYALGLAKAAGLSGSDLDAVSTGALVHDIGKLGIPDRILGKNGKLTAEEFQRIQSHVTIGAEILSPVPFPFPVVDVVLTHHERWDGLGYPRGLRAEEIPIGGRIISIVDVFDALTSNRPYRRALTHEEALEILVEGAGKQFDPHLVKLFVDVLPAARVEIERLESEQTSRMPELSAAVEEGRSAFVQIGQAAAEMAAVCDVAHNLAEQETLDQTLGVVVNRALALLPADTAVLYLRSPQFPQLVAAAVDGKYREKLDGMTIQIGEGVAGWVAAHQQPRVNVPAALDVARRFSPEENIELNAAIAVPLVHGPDNLGVLAVYSMGYSVLSEHHLHVLNILAEHAAVAIQNLQRLERNQELAYTDPLTGLANSRCLVRHLDRLMHPRPSDVRGTQFSIVMLDLDRFKAVNDVLGHLRGDDLLRQVAECLMDLARPADVVCRYAGDEFVLLLPGAGVRQAETVAARVREVVDSIPAVDGKVKIGASVGVASYPDDGADGRSLLHAADQRMYEDKFRRRDDAGARSSRAAVERVPAGR